MFTKSQLFGAAVLAASFSSALAARDITGVEARAIGEYLAQLEARTHGDGSIRPTPQSQNPQKKFQSTVDRVHQVLAITKHKHDEPNHRANRPGVAAHVHDNFHSSHPGGAVHATVDYHNTNRNNAHVTRLHIHGDGTRLTSNRSPVHAPGTTAPPNSPASGHHGSLGHVGGVPVRSHTLRRREILEYLQDVVTRELDLVDELD